MNRALHISAKLLEITTAVLLAAILCSVMDNGNDPARDSVRHAVRIAWLCGILSLTQGLLIALRKTNLRFSPIDAAVALLSGYLLFNYFLNRSTAVTHLYQGILSACLYINARLAFARSRKLIAWLTLVLVLTGAWEAVCGLCQLWGFETSRHTLFRITGSFFNPGPYAGYLAVALTAALSVWIREHRVQTRFIGTVRSRRTFSRLLNLRTATYFVSVGTSLLIPIVLPATMSRASWLAVTLPFGLPFAEKLFRRMRRNIFSGPDRRSGLLITGGTILLLALCTGLCLYGIYTLKRPSADGRILMWKIETKAILDRPWTGVGTGYFGEAYARAQTDYFSEQRSPQEINAAGCPEYGFNEYLQCGVETGTVGLLIVLFLAGATLRSLLRSPDRFRQAWGYALLALLVFACFSYPISLTPFRILAVFFAAAAAGTLPERNRPIPQKRWPAVLLLATAAASFFMLVLLTPIANAYKEWKKVSMLYGMQLYDSLPEEYEPLASHLGHDPRFLFEYGHILNKTGAYELSTRILNRGIRLSCDPMFHNVIGNNHRQSGRNDLAEESYLRAFRLLPNRIYPAYLLAKLYIETGQSEKAERWARIVADFTPKIPSTAVKEMKAEIRRMRSPCNEKTQTTSRSVPLTTGDSR